MHGWVAEIVFGYIPYKTWRYIKESCGGDASEYARRYNSEELPEHHWLGDQNGLFSLHDYSNLGEFYAIDPETSYLSVADEDGELLIDSEKISVFAESEEEGRWDAVCAPKKWRLSYDEVIPKHNRHFWMYVEENKGGLCESEFEIEEDFDKSKLKVYIQKVLYNHADDCFLMLERVEYGDDILWEIGEGEDQDPSPKGEYFYVF